MKKESFPSLLLTIGAGVTLIELVTLTTLGVFYTHRFRQEVDKRLISRIEIAGTLIARSYLSYESFSDPRTMSSLVGEELVEGMLVGATRNIFFSWNPAYIGRDITEVPGVRLEWFTTVQAHPRIERQQDARNSYLVSVTPILAVDGHTPFLFAYIKMKTTQAELEKKGIAVLFMMGSVLAVFATSGVIVALFRLTFSSPLNAFLEVLRRVESGDLSARAEVPRARGELASLRRGINAMVESLWQRVEQLKRAERRASTQYGVTRVLAEASTIAEAAPRILKTYCQNLGWNWGELWMLNEVSGLLECLETVQNSTCDSPVRVSAVSKVPVSSRVGVAERVWATGEPLLLKDLDIGERERSGGGMMSAFGYPLHLGKDLKSVLVFCHRAFLQTEEELLEIFTPTGSQIGQFLERKRAERELAKSEERFQLVARATNDALWDWDLTTDKCWRSAGYARLFGLDVNQVTATFSAWADHLHPQDKASVIAGLRTTIECGERSWQAEYRFRRSDGTYVYILDRGQVLHNSAGQAIRMIGSMMDITDRKKSEQELKQLTGRLLEAQEAERSRVSRELHDGVNQLISAARVRVVLLNRALEGRVEEPLMEHTTKAAELLKQAKQEVRLISRNLRPKELDDLGLMAAVRSMADEFRERTGIDLKLETMKFPEALLPEIELAAYRIVQEALHNVEKHAKASEVTISMVRQNMVLTVGIRDNGQGFDSLLHQTQSTKTGLGLVNMKERAAFVGGSFVLRSAVGKGTEITVRIPLVRTMNGQLAIQL